MPSDYHCWVASSLLLLAIEPCIAIQVSPLLHEARQHDVKEERGPANLWNQTYWQTLENLGNAQYTGIIKVGGQKLKAIIDTGSFELVVLGTNCSKCGTRPNLYDGSKSDSHDAGGLTMEQTYGSGVTYSRTAHDTVEILNLTSDRQHFYEVYDAEMPLLQQDSLAAILGVGPPGSAIKFAEADLEEVNKQLTEYMKTHSTITNKIKKVVKHYDDAAKHQRTVTSVVQKLGIRNMSICLGKESGSSGFYIWNEVATITHPERFETIDVVGDIYWSASLTKVATGHGIVPKTSHKAMREAAEPTRLGCYQENCSAIIDTGTSLIVAPASVVSKIRQAVDAWANAGGTCDDLSLLPELEFKLNGKRFTLPPESYIGRAHGTLDVELEHFMPHLSRYKTNNVLGGRDESCAVLMLSMDADSQFGPLWILGMPFFRRYYTSFGFVEDETYGLRASTMSFSMPDSECLPTYRPSDENWRKQQTLYQESGRKLTNGAQLDVDLSKIRMPRLAHEVKAQFKRHHAAFIHV